MSKMKRMTLQKVKREFKAMDIAEQMLCIGGIKYIFNKDGTLKEEDKSDGNTEIAYISVKGKSGTHVMDASAFTDIMDKKEVDMQVVKPLYEFLAKKTNVEWGITAKIVSIQGNGGPLDLSLKCMVKLHTDYLSNKVNLYGDGATTVFIHNHTNGYEMVPSDEDKYGAATTPGKHVLYNPNTNVYKVYDENGFTGYQY